MIIMGLPLLKRFVCACVWTKKKIVCSFNVSKRIGEGGER